jgi:hypothetical protein
LPPGARRFHLFEDVARDASSGRVMHCAAPPIDGHLADGGKLDLMISNGNDLIPHASKRNLGHRYLDVEPLYLSRQQLGGKSGHHGATVVFVARRSQLPDLGHLLGVVPTIGVRL